MSFANHCPAFDFPYSWEDAFSKFGFDDGDHCFTEVVVHALEAFGAEVETEQWVMHNEIITSIKIDGREQIPEDVREFHIGYDDPRDYLPKELISYLDKRF